MASKKAAPEAVIAVKVAAALAGFVAPETKPAK